LGQLSPDAVNYRGPVKGVDAECERVLRTLPLWFGQEDSLLEYAENTRTFPTFVAEEDGQVIAFLSLQQHFPASWEINCIAVDAEYRNQGVGQSLLHRAQEWLTSQGARTLQVKTLAESHPSEEYAQTRKFYERVGFVPVEVFPMLWGPGLPVLQLIKVLSTFPLHSTNVYL
jgi:N-acetylglutamate synthase-like GNAT family acetyltransferase